MPGICAIVSRSETPACSALLGRMLDRMRHHDWYVESRYCDQSAGVAMGRMSLGYVNTAPQPVTARDGSLVIVMDGELYDPATVARGLDFSDQTIDRQSQAQLLLEGIRRHGKNFLRTLAGSFVAAIWDVPARRLYVCNDRFASRPLYYARSAARFLVASGIAPLMVDEGISRTLNPSGLAQFFTFGHYFGNDTLLDAVRVIPAATWLTYDAEKQTVELDAYWSQLDDLDSASTGSRDWLERIDEAFHQAVEQQTCFTPNLGLALSGGLDARTILGVINHDQTSVKTVCLGMPGSGDHRAAQRLADLVGCQHHNYSLDDEFLHDFPRHIRRMVQLTDGQYLSQCIVMPTLALYRELGIHVLLRGHAGELLHMRKAYNYSLDHEALGIDSDASLDAWLSRRLQAYLLDGVDRPLFQGELQNDMNGLAQESLRACLRPFHGVQPRLLRVWHLFISQRLRRETMLSMVKFNSVVEPRLPYLDHNLVSLLLAAPVSLKLDEQIQTYILRRRRPDFLGVVNTNTGARLGASSVIRACATFRQKILAKLGVPGYQPYERTGLWLRRELAPFTREVLLSDQCLERGIFHPEGIKAVYSNHLANRRNHTYLLLALMVFELGQRLLSGEHTATDCEARRLAGSCLTATATKEV